MAAYYPVFLDLQGKRCVVVGGGQVAERKVHGLLRCHAEVAVVSPDATPSIRDLAENGQLVWHRRTYQESDLQGAFLAIAATDQEAVNGAIASEATREKVILNVVDKPALCTFIAPAVVEKGEVTVAVSTGGSSPALARKIREWLEGSEDLDYALLAGVLSSARKEIKRRGVEVHPDRWQDCISRDLVALVKQDRSQEALDLLLDRLCERSANVPATQSDA